MPDTVELKRRPINVEARDYLLATKLPRSLCNIIAARPLLTDMTTLNAIVTPSLSGLDSPFLLRDMNKAVDRLLRALKNKECIGIETDHDCDGQTSHAVIYTALTNHFQHPKDKVKSYISHRLTEGYGLCDPVAERILNDHPALVITADNGSTDEPRIKRLNEAGIDVIVTDHHALPEAGPPKSAYACINPTRQDCDYPDPFIAGCMVAWLLMAATRNKALNEAIMADHYPSMVDLLDYVAVGTVADCVSLARSINNRAVIKYGLRLMQQQLRPCWRAVLARMNKSTLYAEDIGFNIGPLLNSDGRLSNAFGSVSFLLAETDVDATAWVAHLSEQNTRRKAIQKTITQAAMQHAKQLVSEGKQTLAIYLEDGHAGVHGISASRVKDACGRPCVIFSPKTGSDNLLTGSCRSIDGVHMQQALCWINQHNPTLLVTFGGHHGAAGVTIQQNKFNAFALAFDEAVQQQVGDRVLGPVILTDGVLSDAAFNLNMVDQLQGLDPYGREFEKPIFEATVTVMHQRALGDRQQHIKFTFMLDNGACVDAIWFNATEGIDDYRAFNVQDKLHIAFTIEDNVYRGKRSLQLFICYATLINERSDNDVV